MGRRHHPSRRFKDLKRNQATKAKAPTADARSTAWMRRPSLVQAGQPSRLVACRPVHRRPAPSAFRCRPTRDTTTCGSGRKGADRQPRRAPDTRSVRLGGSQTVALSSTTVARPSRWRMTWRTPRSITCPVPSTRSPLTATSSPGGPPRRRVGRSPHPTTQAQRANGHLDRPQADSLRCCLNWQRPGYLIRRI